MEGPQIKALAERLHDALAGQCVERIDIPRNRWQANVLLMNCAGNAIQHVRPRGKWLLFDFSHGVTWLCHLFTRATWKVQHAPVPLVSRFTSENAPPPCPKAPVHPDPHALLTLSLRDGTTATLTGRPLFLILPTPDVANHPELRALGPDPLSSHFSREDFLFRLRQHPNKTLAAALLDQQVVAGIGNQNKCEILFAARLAPETRVGCLFASEMERVADMLLAVTQRAYRHHADIERQCPANFVYDRAGEPCCVCSSEIAVDRSAADAHWTWHCPACQSSHHEPTLFDV